MFIIDEIKMKLKIINKILNTQIELWGEEKVIASTFLRHLKAVFKKCL